MLVDLTTYDTESTGTLQCSPAGFIKHSQDNANQCANTAKVLNIAIARHQSGDYRACDYTTLTSTATNSYASTVTTTVTSSPTSSLTSTVTSTATSRIYGKMDCALHDGVTYLYPSSDCPGQIVTLARLLEKCDDSLTENLKCGKVDNEEFIASERVVGCTAVAAAVNAAVDSIMFPRGYAAGIYCSIDGYLVADKSNCDVVASHLNDAMDGFVYGDFHECVRTSFTTSETTTASTSQSTTAATTVTTTAGSTVTTTVESTVTTSGTSTATTSETSTATASLTSTATTSGTATAKSTITTTPTTTPKTQGSTTMISTQTSTESTTQTTTITTSQLLDIFEYDPPRGATGVNADTAIILKFFGPIKAGTGYISLKPQTLTGEEMDTIEINVKDTTQVTFYREAYEDTENFYGLMQIQPEGALPVHQQALTYRVSVTSDAIVEDNYKSSKTYRAIQIVDYEFTLKDVNAPHANVMVPANGATELSVVVSRFGISFDEPVQVGTGGVVTIAKETPDGTTVHSYDLADLSITLNVDNTAITVSPDPDGLNNVPFFEAAQEGAKFIIVAPAGFVVDAAGNPYAGLSAGQYTFSVTDAMAPKVAPNGFSPTNSAVGIASTEPIEIIFNEPVRPGKGNIVIQGLGFDGDDATCTVSAVDTTQVRFVDNKMTIRCNGGLQGGVIGRTFRVLMEPGVVTDTAKNPNSFAGLARGDFEFTVIDSVAPLLLHMYPANGTVDVPLDVEISMNFTETIFVGSGSITLTPSDTGVPTVYDVEDSDHVKIDLNIVVIYASEELTSASDLEQTYKVAITEGALVDKTGNPFAGIVEDEWMFDVVDAVKPSVKTIRPRDKATSVPKNTHVYLSFDEEVKAGSGTITFISPSPTLKTLTISVPSDEVFISGTTVRVDPVEDLDPGTAGREYSFSFTAGTFVDVSSSANNCSALLPGEHSFAVEDANEPFISDFSPSRASTTVSEGATIVLTTSENVVQGKGYITFLPTESKSFEVDVADSTQVTFSGNLVTITLNKGQALRSGPTGQTYFVEIERGAITDEVGIPLPAILFKDYYFQLADVTKPRIVSAVPRHESNLVSRSSDIRFVFSEAISTNAIFTLQSTVDPRINISVVPEITNAGKALLIREPFMLVPPFQVAEVYSLIIGSDDIVDHVGNTFKGLRLGDYTLTTEDILPPALLHGLSGSFNPMNNAVGVVSTTSIVVHFNEPVRAGSGNVVLEGSGFDGDAATCTVAVVDTTQVTFDSNIMTVDCNGGLDGGPFGRTFQMLLEPGVVVDTAMSPNSYVGLLPGNFTFTVLDTSSPHIVEQPIDSIEGLALTSGLRFLFNEQVYANSGASAAYVVLTPSITGEVISIHPSDTSQVYISTEEPWEMVISPTGGFVSALGIQTYEVSLPAGLVADATGNGLVTGLDFTIHVEDAVGPSIISTMPEKHASDILKGTKIQIMFDEGVQPGNGSLVLQSSNSSEAPSEMWMIDINDPSVLFFGGGIIFDPFPEFLRSNQDSERYTLSIPAGAILDQAYSPNTYVGNEIVTQFTVLNAFRNVTFSTSSTAAGDVTSLHVSFTTLNEISSFESIVLTMPTTDADSIGFDFDAAALLSGFATITPYAAMYFVYGNPAEGTVVVQKIGGQLLPPGSQVEFIVAGVSLPRILGTTANFKLQSADMDGFVHNEYTNIPGIEIVNVYPPDFDEEPYVFAMEENFVYESCGSMVTFSKLGLANGDGVQYEVPGECEPSNAPVVIVGKVSATDRDMIPGTNISYSIVGGTGSAYFVIDPFTGTLSSKLFVDRDDGSPFYIVEVQAQDGSFPFRVSTTIVNVTITDVNDNTPIFALPPGLSYFEVMVHTDEDRRGSAVGILTALDADSGSNAQFQFSLDGEVPGFAINAFTGEVELTYASTAEYKAFETMDAFVQDSPAFPGEPRVTRSRVNVKTISNANMLTTSITLNPNARFDKDGFEESMTAAMCTGEVKCVSRVWTAPGVFRGNFVGGAEWETPDPNPREITIKYYLDAPGAATVTRTVTKQQMAMPMGGMTSEEYASMSEESKEAAKAAMILILSEQYDLPAYLFDDIVLQPVDGPAGRKSRRQLGGFEFVFTLKESVGADDAVALTGLLADTISSGNFPPIPLMDADGNAFEAIADPVVLNEPEIVEIEVPAPFSAEPTPTLSADDVASLLNDPAIQANLESLARAYSGSAVNLGVDDKDNSTSKYGSLSEMEFIALVSSSLVALLLVVIAVYIHVQSKKSRMLVGDAGQTFVFGTGWGSAASPPIDSIVNPSQWHDKAPDNISYFDVVPAIQQNDNYDYDVDNMMIPEENQITWSGQVPTGMDPSQMYGSGRMMMPNQLRQPMTGGPMMMVPGQPMMGASLIPGHHMMPDNGGLGVLLANDQELFGQEFQNPLHPDNYNGGGQDLYHNPVGGANGWSAQPEVSTEQLESEPEPEPGQTPINMDDVHTDAATGALYLVDEVTGESKWLDDDDASSFFTNFTQSEHPEGENPMNVLLDNDQAMFGQQFNNPLHYSGAAGGDDIQEEPW